MNRKRVIVRAICFSFVVVIILLCLEKLFFTSIAVCDTWEDIQDKTKEAPDVLFIGNLHIYTSINPKLIQDSMGIKAEILGSASQPAELTLPNLEIALRYKTPGCIVCEANVLLTDCMEELKREKRGYIINNFDGVKNYYYKGQALLRTLPIDLLPEGMLQLFRPVETWKRWENLKWKIEHPEKEELKLGYRPLEKVAVTDFFEGHAERQKELYETVEAGEIGANNEDAFRKMLEMAQEKNIPFYVYKSVIAADNMAPLASGCLRIQKIMEEYDNAYWIGDWNSYTDIMQINSDDFYEGGHVNRKGSIKQTFFMMEQLEEIFEIESDMNNVFAYQTESIVKFDQSMYRYSMTNTLSGTRYSFILYEDGVNMLETQFSSNNYIDLPELLHENQSLTCVMIPPDCDEGDYRDVAKKGMRISFMKELDTNKAVLVKQ